MYVLALFMHFRGPGVCTVGRVRYLYTTKQQFVLFNDSYPCADPILCNVCPCLEMPVHALPMSVNMHSEISTLENTSLCFAKIHTRVQKTI